MSVWHVLVAVAFVVCGVIVVVVQPGVDDNEAVGTLQDQGFTDVHVMDHGIVVTGFEGCGEDDGVYYRTRATSAAGKEIRLLVCCGLAFKGCTVRSVR